MRRAPCNEARHAPSPKPRNPPRPSYQATTLAGARHLGSPEPIPPRTPAPFPARDHPIRNPPTAIRPPPLPHPHTTPFGCPPAGSRNGLLTSGSRPAPNGVAAPPPPSPDSPRPPRHTARGGPGAPRRPRRSRPFSSSCSRRRRCRRATPARRTWSGQSRAAGR